MKITQLEKTLENLLALINDNTVCLVTISYSRPGGVGEGTPVPSFMPLKKLSLQDVKKILDDDRYQIIRIKKEESDD